MKISITLNEVLRDFLSQLSYSYEKYIGQTDVKKEDITSYNFIDYFKFDTIDKFNHFLYFEAPLEIFGHADQLYDGLMSKFNAFLSDIEEEDEEHQVELVNREVDKAIPSTLFFLSKTGAKIKNIRFVSNYEDAWDNTDVLITACPKILENKPEDKISVKVNAPYNKNSAADYTIESILDFINDANLRNKILTKTITTTYEQL